MQVGRATIPDSLPPPSGDAVPPTSGPGFDQLIAAAQAEAERRAKVTETTGATADRFSDQAWLAIIRAHGGEIGLSAQAAAIQKDGRGQMTVADSVMRARIMALRNNPVIVSVMASRRAGDARAVLTTVLGRVPTADEMRVASALGGKEASLLFKARQASGDQPAANVLPSAAAARRAVFFRPDGTPQTVNDVLARLMQPAPASATSEAERLANGHLTFANPTAPAGPALPAVETQQQNSRVATRPQSPGAQPDIDLTAATLGQVSIPGSTTGVTAPTGAKVTGWRGQLTSQVTDHLSHPASAVRNVPSNVTVPADPSSGYQPVARVAATDPAAAAVQDQPKSLRATPQPNAAKPPILPPVPETPRLPAVPEGLLSLAPLEPTGRVPTSPPAVPASDQPAPAPVGPAESADAIYVRPSRYGPGSVTTVPIAVDASSEAAGAGIRPSRYSFAAAISVQQQASAANGPLMSVTSRPAPPPAAAPVVAHPTVGTDRLLAQPGQTADLTRTADNRPLDLAPDAASQPVQPPQPIRRGRPHTIPARF